MLKMNDDANIGAVIALWSHSCKYTETKHNTVTSFIKKKLNILY